jgi:hypothetical protein
MVEIYRIKIFTQRSQRDKDHKEGFGGGVRNLSSGQNDELADKNTLFLFPFSLFVFFYALSVA